MTLALSGTNHLNIEADHLRYDVLVEMPDLSPTKQWSSGSRSGYEERILNVTEIRQSVDPLGGVASLSNFRVTIQQETPTQFIQENNPENTTVEVYIQFGSDQKIPLITGQLDRWELRSGEMDLFCIGQIGLKNKEFPAERLSPDVSAFSSWAIPDRNLNKWVPLTIGAAKNALGYMADTRVSPSFTSGEGMRVLYNSEVSGHDGINTLNQARIFTEDLNEHLNLLSSLVVNSGDEWLTIDRKSGATIESVGFVEVTWTPIPSGASQDGGGTTPADATDDDFTTFAQFENIGSGGSPSSPSNTIAHLRVKIPSTRVPEAWWVNKTESGNGSYSGTLALLADMDRQPQLNLFDRTGERVDGAIEIDSGTFPSTAALVESVMSGSDSGFDNLNERNESETAVTFSLPDYDDEIGDDTTNTGSNDSIRVEAVLGRNLALEYEESDTGADEDFHVEELRLRIDFRADGKEQVYTSDVEGYIDDGSGTYTGTANALIENPADVVRWLMDQYLGLSGFNAGSFQTARDDLGGFKMSGQMLDRVDAREELNRIGQETGLRIFLGADNNFSASGFTIPTTGPDRELRQPHGDFTTGRPEAGAWEGEITRVTQTPVEDLYNQFLIRYNWDAAKGVYRDEITLDETTTSSGLGHGSGDAIGSWLTASQNEYNVTRQRIIEADWIQDFNSALALGHRLIYQHADRKRVVECQTSVNAVDLEIGDMTAVVHDGVERAADTTIHSGYETDQSGTVAESGFTDPDTSATVKCGADVQIHGVRHIYEVVEVRAQPMEGTQQFRLRQASVSRTPLTSPVTEAGRIYTAAPTSVSHQLLYLDKDANGVWGFTDDPSDDDGDFSADSGGVLGIDDATTNRDDAQRTSGKVLVTNDGA